jgi:hypothetical protein
MDTDGINSGDLNPYLDAIVERLLRSLNPTGDNVKEPKRYVQERNIYNGSKGESGHVPHMVCTYLIIFPISPKVSTS